MSGPFEQLAGLDKLIHEPARLAICTALAACERADFVYLQRLTGLSKGNLSAHLSKLESADIVTIHKGFKGKIPRTEVALTAAGQAALERHWTRLDELRRGADAWQPDDAQTAATGVQPAAQSDAPRRGAPQERADG